MTPTITIQELAIIIAAPNHTPTLLTPDFLKATGVVPIDWELARPPKLTPAIAQVSFTNGINIIAQPGTITFIESLTTNPTKQLEIPTLARKYVEILSNVNYQAVSINIRTFVTFDESVENAARTYITSTLLNNGEWSNFGIAPVVASINLSYSLEARPLNLSIIEAQLQLPEKPAQSTVLFTGNFTYEIQGETAAEKQQHLFQLIDNYQPDLSDYKALVNDKFLGHIPQLQPEELECSNFNKQRNT